MCQALGVSKSGFYDWLKAPVGKRAAEEADIGKAISELFEESRRTYGSRRIRQALKKRKIRASRRRVIRIMRKLGISPSRKRRFVATTDSRHRYPVHRNLLGRNFGAEASNCVWASDITYVPTDEGWLYLATVVDLFSRRIVGWSMSRSLGAKLAVDALEMVVRARNPRHGLIHHSDRGVQYACSEYQNALRGCGMLCSMSRKGDCWDNAMAESFFSTLKKELVHRTRFKTREQARAAIFEFIEVFYNRTRMHSLLGYMSPAEFEAAEAA
jgi:transposase InsO family protein